MICIELEIRLEEDPDSIGILKSHKWKYYQERGLYNWVYDFKASLMNIPCHVVRFNSYVHLTMWRDNTMNVIY